MKHNIYLYIFLSGIVIYLIRILPIVLIRKPIKNKLIRRFLKYVPYVTLAVMTFPAITAATEPPFAGLAAMVTGVITAWYTGDLFKTAVVCSLTALAAQLLFAL